MRLSSMLVSGVQRIVKGLACTAGLASVILANEVFADPILDFGIMPSKGPSISYAGGAKPLIGKNISVTTVTGLDTPLHDGGTLHCIGCLLSFQTGPMTGSDAATWEFGGGALSWLALVGRVDLDGHPATLADDLIGTPLHPLLEGYFEYASVFKVSNSFRILGGESYDHVLPKLGQYYGLESAGYIGDLNLSFSSTPGPPLKFSSTHVFSGDLAMTAVPEPASLGLSCLAVIAVGVLARRKRGSAPLTPPR